MTPGHGHDEPMSRHRNGTTTRSLAVPYAVLVFAGTSSVIFNIVHAFRHAGGSWALPALYGLGSVFVAVCMSHVAAEGRTGRFLRAVVVLIMVASMAGSIGAITSVVTPFAGARLALLYGLTMDAAALASLRVILADRNREREDAAAVQTARAEAASAVSRAAGLEADLVAVRAELGAVTDERDALHAEALQLRAPAKPSGAVARKRRNAPADDLTLEARALNLLATDLDMTGAELARRLGVSPGYGRKLRTRLTAGPQVQERSQERAAGSPGKQMGIA